MSYQAKIDAFVNSAGYGTLTPEGVTSAVVNRGIPVNGRGCLLRSTALYYTALNRRRELVVALLAVGADANAKNKFGQSSVWAGAIRSADILQLLIDGGGSVNEVTDFGDTPLIALVKHKRGDNAARLKVLLACPDLDLDAEKHGKTAEQWAMETGRSELAVAIAEERAGRERWGGLRAAWIAATIAPITALFIT
jgi:ankyrin repeat protein